MSSIPEYSRYKEENILHLDYIYLLVFAWMQLVEKKNCFSNVMRQQRGEKHKTQGCAYICPVNCEMEMPFLIAQHNRDPEGTS